ncbi:MAG: hypothetical protein GY799_10915, partial [Desulfobulbaceae bacterium]|nr:hypothetical protein [Desulfobulbaceae bacterium]
GDPDDWPGRPVAFDVGAHVKLFLTVLPLSPLDAKKRKRAFRQWFHLMALPGAVYRLSSSIVLKTRV